MFNMFHHSAVSTQSKKMIPIYATNFKELSQPKKKQNKQNHQTTHHSLSMAFQRSLSLLKGQKEQETI